jgi:hypothetical protein
MQDSQSNEGQSASSDRENKKSYMEKLLLIKDIPSQQKVRLEIERFMTMSKHQSEYHKT